MLLQNLESTETNYEPTEDEIIKKEIMETPKEYKLRWRSIRILYLTMFFDSFSFSVVLSSIWPYLQKVDTTNTLSPVYAGWAIIGFQLAGIAIDFIMGFWINKRGSKEPLLVSLFFFGFGNLLYAYAQSCGTSAVAIVITSRTIIGLSTGIDVVSRSATSDATSLKERSTAIAHMSLAQGAGFTFGPALQLLSMPLGDKGIFIDIIKLHVNVYTTPAIISIIISVINGILIAASYREYHIDIYKDQDGDNYVHNYKQVVAVQTKTKQWDKRAVLLVLFLYFIGQNAFAFQETILTPLSMDQFAWTREQTTLYVGLIFFAAGMIAVATFAVTDVLVNRFDDRKILVCGFVLMFIGFSLYLPWGSNSLKIKMEDSSKTIFSSSNTTSTSLTYVGCPKSYEWCHTLPSIHLAQVIVGMIFLSIGYAFIMCMTTSLYSKILGPIPQGFMQSWFSAIGGMARSTGPALVTHIYVSLGPRWTFLTVDSLIIISLTILLIGYKRLIPFHKFVVKSKTILSSIESVIKKDLIYSATENMCSGKPNEVYDYVTTV